MKSFALILVFVSVPGLCYRSGKVLDSCEDLRPHHRQQSPQSQPAPFIISTDSRSYRPGQQVTVVLQALGSTPFTGFLLQARAEGTGSPVGSFTLQTTGAQLLRCHHRPNSAVSHTSNSDKTRMELIWISDPETPGEPVTFHATFVQDFRTFWTNVTSPALIFNKDISGEGCGLSKVCFRRPDDCDPALGAECFFMSASVMPAPNDTAIFFQMTGPSDGYVSFGFSDDQMMGNDDIYVCGIGSDGRVLLHRAFSTGHTAPQVSDLGSVSDVRTSVQDSVISCSFTSRNSISTERSTGISRAYYIMFAHGPSREGQIQIHSGKFVSSDKMDLSRPQTVGEAGLPLILKAHGALMLTAWMSLGSMGMLVSRYLKGATRGRKLCGKDVWFQVHVAVMSVTVVATMVAFILSFSHVRGWSEGAHSVLGCLVLILSLVQPMVALLRCGPEHQLRRVFNWFHSLNSVVIKSVAVAAIFTGLESIDRTGNQWLMKVMGGFVGWEAIFYLVMEALFKLKSISSSSSSSSTEVSESDTITLALLITGYFLGNCSFLVSLLVGIGKS